MRDDLLSQYRKTPPAPGGGKVPPSEAEEYAAFGTKDKVLRLRIRSLAEPVHSPGYNILLDVVYDGQKGTNFMLVYTVLAVLVQGKNLQNAVFAIENGKADFIQEFDADRWEKPKDANAAFIESIQIKVTGSGSEKMETAH